MADKTSAGLDSDIESMKAKMKDAPAKPAPADKTETSHEKGAAGNNGGLQKRREREQMRITIMQMYDV